MPTEQQLNVEIEKNQNLLKMNHTLMIQNDQFTKALGLIQRAMHSKQNQYSNLQDDEQNVQPQNAQNIAKQVIQIISQYTKKSEEYQRFQEQNQWKSMYIQQSQQTYRLSQINCSLLQQRQINHKMKVILMNQAKQLLNDYLILYKKLHSYFHESEVQMEVKHNKNKNKSKIISPSRSKSKNNQLRKQNLPINLQGDHNLSNKHTLVMLQSSQNQLHALQEQIQTLIQQNLEKQELIRLYRQKQRNRLLYSL